MFYQRKPTWLRFCFSLILLSLSVCFNSVYADTARLLIIGDSLSAAHGIPVEKGWVALLSEKLQAEGYPVEVINRSVSGAATQDGLNRMDAWLQEFEPDYVLLALGSNDGLRGIPIRRIKRNIETMIERVREADAEPILIGFMVPPNYGQAYFEAFRDVFPALAEDEDLPFVPFLLAKVADDRQTYFQEDGLHPNVIAQPIILENVWPTLREVLKRQQ